MRRPKHPVPSWHSANGAPAKRRMGAEDEWRKWRIHHRSINLMWVKQVYKPSTSHHHFYRWCIYIHIYKPFPVMAGSWHCFNHIPQFIWDCELIHSSDWFMGQMGKTGQNLHGSNASIPAEKGLFDEAGRWTSPWFYPIRMYIQRSIIVYWLVVWMIVYFCI